MESLGVIVLTGGGSTRMGRHKPALDVGGRPIIARILEACAGLPLVVAGDGAAVPPHVRVVREEPPGGGPVAGIAAGFTALISPYAAHSAPSAPSLSRVAVLAGDLPFLTRAALEDLDGALEEDPSAELALAVDHEQRVNWLCGVWRTGVLARRLEAVGDPAGVSVKRLIDSSCRALVADASGWSADVDTPDDLAAARDAATRQR
ncbi:molybdopterin-guanine dinucleotide biosynthesis protein [Intrasporangium chromatireducens Q5-1]|uniref:Molybdopterin-guanine dinucleotide biosynthesis protein n=1 Tax=Intrasporangium chromatireducens Q5-1 TaxID=584657 RepID=W9GAA8_9MICO|nr:molybdopterin-guanine dinucleotide biosynthesis protein [Intrasporangium chromatireducens Q5-1]